MDGVYVEDDSSSEPKFIAIQAPTDKDIQRVVETVAKRVIRMLIRRGVISKDECSPDPLSEVSPLLSEMSFASIENSIGTGERKGQRVRRVLSDPAEGQRQSSLCYASRGFSTADFALRARTSFHGSRKIAAPARDFFLPCAATSVKATHRQRLEELCRYIARPPLAKSRLKILEDGQLLVKLKTRWSDGTTHLMLSPMEFIEKLASLVPPPRYNQLRYHGVLAPNAKMRKDVVPRPPEEVCVDIEHKEQVRSEPEPYKSKSRRMSWAQLLKRVFKFDVEICGHCGGKMQIVAAVLKSSSIREYLDGVGLESTPPYIAPARSPPQTEFDF